jgi:septal ring factor EnvC (AmiA/AmiB activator)
MKTFVMLLATTALFAGCVPTSQLKQSQAESAALRDENRKLSDKGNDLESNIAQLKTNISALNEQIETLNSQNSVMGKQATNTQNKLNQSQGNLQVEQERLLRLQKLLAQQREQSDALKNKMSEADERYSNSVLDYKTKVNQTINLGIGIMILIGLIMKLKNS